MNDGKNIYEIIKYMRKLYEQISILCQTSDKLLGKYDWECVHGNTCMHDSSSSLQAYSKWQPQCVFRFYMNNNEKNNNMVYISVILDDRNNDFEKFDEPLITAGFLKSKNNIDIETIKRNYHYWWSRFYVWSYCDMSRFRRKRKTPLFDLDTFHQAFLPVFPDVFVNVFS